MASYLEGFHLTAQATNGQQDFPPHHSHYVPLSHLKKPMRNLSLLCAYVFSHCVNQIDLLHLGNCYSFSGTLLFGNTQHLQYYST